MEKLIEKLVNCKRLKTLTPIFNIEYKLTLEDYDIIKNFQIVNGLTDYYRICNFVIEMKKQHNMQNTYRALELYYNLNK